MSKEQPSVHRTARSDAISLRAVIVAVLAQRPQGATLAEIYQAVEADRPATSTDAIRGELNHGVAVGRYVRLAPGHYGVRTRRTATRG